MTRPLEHDVDLGASIHVGTGPADRGFAARLGMRFVDAASWLAGEVVPESPP